LLVWGERPDDASLIRWLSAFVAISVVLWRSELETEEVEGIGIPTNKLAFCRSAGEDWILAFVLLVRYGDEKEAAGHVKSRDGFDLLLGRRGPAVLRCQDLLCAGIGAQPLSSTAATTSFAAGLFRLLKNPLQQAPGVVRLLLRLQQASLELFDAPSFNLRREALFTLSINGEDAAVMVAIASSARSGFA